MKASITELLMIRPRPMVKRIWFCGGAARVRLMTIFWRKAPKRNINGIVMKIDRNGST